MRSTVLLSAVCICALTAVSGAANADTMTFTNFAEANGKDNNFDGTWDAFYQLSPMVNFMAYNGTAGYIGGVNTYDIRGAMEFDVRALPAHATIASATLRIHYEGASGGAASSLQFNGYLGDGVMEYSDFTAGSMVGGQRFNSFGPGANSNGYFNIPVTDLLQQVDNAGNGYAGFSVFNVVTNQTLLGASLSNNPPSLVVNYTVPEPVSLSTLAIGSVLVRRRRTR